MSAERWSRIRSLLEEARELPATERAAYLTQACGGDAELRAEIESLIAHGDDSGDLLDRSQAESTLADPPPRRPVERVGPYRIEREIGRGGMGAVYLAIRDDDSFERRVALKLLHPGMVSDDIVRRFKNERQILAGIDHPHVAKLYDGGTTDDGLPYLVMEYIEGSRIDDYCDAHRLSIEKRLEVFRNVCSAVHFAHQNLVIHRDLKPANILVTAEGEPKLLDFGIAKLLNPELAAATLGTTHAETRLLTPEYASPEQIKGEPISTASDVYALGVLLYRLLTGHSPYRLSGVQLHQLARVICETEPPPPSAVIDVVEETTGSDGTKRVTATTVASTREGSPERLRRKLAGDLDNIALMSLRKEPTRRYSSVEQLSEDIRRFLEGLPVTARRGTLAYRGSKFVRRHRVSFASAAVAVFALLSLTAFSVRERMRAEWQRDRAEVEAAKSSAVVEFLVETLGSADPDEGSGRDVTVAEALAAAVERMDESFGDQPEILAALKATIGATYRELALYDEAEPLLRSALDIQRSTLGPAHVELARSLNSMGMLHEQTGDFQTAESLFREALSVARSLDEEHTQLATSLNNVAYVLHQTGRHEEAEPLHREALALRQKLHGREHRLVAESLTNLAYLLSDMRRYREAEPLYREGLAIYRRVLGDTNPRVALTLNNLSTSLHATGSVEEAESVLRESLAICRTALGNDHPQTASALNNLAAMLAGRGAFDEAEEIYRESAGILRRRFGNEHPNVAIVLSNLAKVLDDKGEHAAAGPLHFEAVSLSEGFFGATDWRAATLRMKYGRCLTELKRFSEAEALLLGSYPVLREEFGAQHDRTRKAVEHLAALYESWGKTERAAEYRAVLDELAAGDGGDAGL